MVRDGCATAQHGAGCGRVPNPTWDGARTCPSSTWDRVRTHPSPNMGLCAGASLPSRELGAVMLLLHLEFHTKKI